MSLTLFDAILNNVRTVANSAEMPIDALHKCIAAMSEFLPNGIDRNWCAVVERLESGRAVRMSERF